MIFDVQIEQLGLCALFDIQGPQIAIATWGGPALPSFPTAPNTGTRQDDSKLYWLGAETWMLRAPLAREAALEMALKPPLAPDDISIVCISDTLVFWRITGPEADQIMSIAGPLDVHPSTFPAQGATWSEIFGQRALVLRVKGGFEIAVERSYGPMFNDYLNRIVA